MKYKVGRVADCNRYVYRAKRRAAMIEMWINSRRKLKWEHEYTRRLKEKDLSEVLFKILRMLVMTEFCMEACSHCNRWKDIIYHEWNDPVFQLFFVFSIILIEFVSLRANRNVISKLFCTYHIYQSSIYSEILFIIILFIIIYISNLNQVFLDCRISIYLFAEQNWLF